MAGPGGRIAPDGRPAVAPGVGKNARRHDLEAPATPGLSNSDLQQGDVQRLEQAQKIAPRPKKTQGSATAKPAPPKGTAQSGGFQMEVPDPIAFASGKMGGNNPAANMQPQRIIDPTPWVPLLRSLATRPNSGGTIAATLTDLLMQYRRNPVVAATYFIDMNEMDATIAKEL